MASDCFFWDSRIGERWQRLRIPGQASRQWTGRKEHDTRYDLWLFEGREVGDGRWVSMVMFGLKEFSGFFLDLLGIKNFIIKHHFKYHLKIIITHISIKLTLLKILKIYYNRTFSYVSVYNDNIKVGAL